MGWDGEKLWETENSHTTPTDSIIDRKWRRKTTKTTNKTSSSTKENQQSWAQIYELTFRLKKWIKMPREIYLLGGSEWEPNEQEKATSTLEGDSENSDKIRTEPNKSKSDLLFSTLPRLKSIFVSWVSLQSEYSI